MKNVVISACLVSLALVSTSFAVASTHTLSAAIQSAQHNVRASQHNMLMGYAGGDMVARAGEMSGPIPA